MLRNLFALLIFCSCSMGTVKTGGERAYVYDASSDYLMSDLKDMSSEVVMSEQREPHFGTHKALFGKNQEPLKRIGIVIFETEIQPTRSGLAENNLIYPTAAGKQIISENFLRIWEESLKVLAPEIDYVPTAEVRKARSFHEYGNAQDDYVKSARSSLAPDDIFFLESGKKTPMETVLNPRRMRDMSFLLVPAYDLMKGPKWSEHNKHFLNDVAKELNLDAALIVMSKVSWTAAHTDKHSGEFIPEEIKVIILSSTLIPLHKYHERLEKINKNDRPGVTLAYRSYEAEMQVPALISLPEESRKFENIEQELLAPMFKTYKDLSQMTIMRIVEDLKKTW